MAIAPPKIPLPVRALAGALSLAVLATALAGMGIALAGRALDPDFKPAWAMFGFEAIVAVSALIGLLFALGRFREGPGMALACVSGAIFAGSVLGYFSVSGVLAGIGLKPFLLARVAAAAALAVGGAFCVLSRDRRSWTVLFRGIVLGAPVLAVGAMAAVPAGRDMLGVVFEAGALVQMTVVVLGALVLGGLFAASVHQIIRAFELGHLDEAAPPSDIAPSDA